MINIAPKISEKISIFKAVQGRDTLSGFKNIKYDITYIKSYLPEIWRWHQRICFDMQLMPLLVSDFILGHILKING